jgi:HNH endonuclease
VTSRTEPPAAVKLQLRRKAGFGCYKCGFPIVQYHHIIPFAERPEHDPANMMMLCPTHHDEMPAVPEQEQRSLKTAPFNVERGYTEGPLRVNHKYLAVDVGPIIVHDDVVISVRGSPLLSLRADPEGRLLLSVVLMNETWMGIAQVVDNE